MKIKDNTRREIFQFSFLADGAVFKGKNGSICFKFPKLVHEDNEDESCEYYNAYDLTNDKFIFVSFSDRVEKIQAELVLSNFNETIT